MTLLPITTTALALAAAFWLALRRRPQTSALALPLTACAMAGAFLAFGLWVQVTQTIPMASSTPTGQGYRQTDYSLIRGGYISLIGWAYIAVPLVILTVQRLGGARVQTALPWLFCAFAIGSTISALLPVFPILSMPLRYGDYPDWFRRTHQLSIAADLLAAAGLLGMLALLLIAARTSLIHRRP